MGLILEGSSTIHPTVILSAKEEDPGDRGRPCPNPRRSPAKCIVETNHEDTVSLTDPLLPEPRPSPRPVTGPGSKPHSSPDPSHPSDSRSGLGLSHDGTGRTGGTTGVERDSGDEDTPTGFRSKGSECANRLPSEPGPLVSGDRGREQFCVRGLHTSGVGSPSRTPGTAGLLSN